MFGKKCCKVNEIYYVIFTSERLIAHNQKIILKRKLVISVLIL